MPLVDTTTDAHLGMSLLFFVVALLLSRLSTLCFCCLGILSMMYEGNLFGKIIKYR